jgi:hypothetical protein
LVRGTRTTKYVTGPIEEYSKFLELPGINFILMNIENQKNIGYETLCITLKEVLATNNIILAKEIERILENNQLPKPILHERTNDLSTTFYKIDLTSDQIEEVVDILLALEAQFVNEKGEATPMSSYFASLVDTWNSLRHY